MGKLDFISLSDKPALLAVTRPNPGEGAEVLTQLGYKVHVVPDHAQFLQRFSQVNYEIVLLDESFCPSPEGNVALRTLQNMPMALRRHATLLLLGANFETLNPLQAFAQSVHCVINYTDLPLLAQLVQKTAAENQAFLAPFLEVQRTGHLARH